jgi:hypothetical protein
LASDFEAGLPLPFGSKIQALTAGGKCPKLAEPDVFVLGGRGGCLTRTASDAFPHGPPTCLPEKSTRPADGAFSESKLKSRIEHAFELYFDLSVKHRAALRSIYEDAKVTEVLLRHFSNEIEGCMSPSAHQVDRFDLFPFFVGILIYLY